MSTNTDHTLDSTLAPATNAAGLAPPSSASGSATVGSGGGLLGGTAGTGAAQMPLAPSIYKLQGRNPNGTIAKTGKAKKSIVSTRNEKTDEKGVTWHEYYHIEMLQRDGTVLDKDKFWYREQGCIKDAKQLNQLLLNQWGRVKGKGDVRESNNETQQHIANAKASLAMAERSAAKTDRLAGGSGVSPAPNQPSTESTDLPAVASGVTATGLPSQPSSAAPLASAGKPQPAAAPKPKGVRVSWSSDISDLCGAKKGAAVSGGKLQPTAAQNPKPAAKAQISRQSPKHSTFDPAELKFFNANRPLLLKEGIIDPVGQNKELERRWLQSQAAAGGARGNKKDALKRLAPSKAAAKVSSPRNGATKWANYYDLKRDFKALGGGECLSEPWFKEQSLQDRKRFLESQIHAIQHPKKMRMSYRKPQPAAAVESSDDDESQADADATGASADWRPDAWMDKPGVKFDKDACDLFGKRIEMDLNGTREPAVIKAYTPDARAPYGVVFDSQPDTTRWENLLRPGRTDWQEIGWGGDDLVDSETAYLRPVCPHCGIALDEGRAAWTKCLACGECEPGVHAAKVISRMNKDDPYRCPPPAYAESDDE